MKAAQFTVDYINKLLSPRKKFCDTLQLKKILDAKQSVISKDTFYQLHFITSPNDGEYQLLIKHVESDFLISSPSSISRINQYGNHHKCLENAPPDSNVYGDLRSFCFCL